MRRIRKIFYTTLTTFIILTVYTLSNIETNVLRTNLELENITNIKTNKVYLLNKDNYLTEIDIFLEKDTPTNQAINIINYLKESNKKVISKYKGYIPSNTKVIDINIDNNIIYLNLSKEFLSSDINITVPGLVKSLIGINGIEKVDIKINNNYLDYYDRPLDKKISINKEYIINNRSDIDRVVIYYLSDDNNYIPVTKYLNDKREKIEIIIDELKNNENNNLISYLSNNVKLVDYKEENNILFLTFNSDFLKDENIIEYNMNEIAYSIFDNYDVSSVMFIVNKENIKIINK